MKVAAFQAAIPAGSLSGMVEDIGRQVRACEDQGISILCCPEAILGGLADQAADPKTFAIASNRLGAVLSPLGSETVTSLVGFTELGFDDQLYNSIAVFQGGRVAGIYRKRYPALRQSVYSAGDESPIFTVNGLAFGIMICNDSNHPELAADLVNRGARAIFIPSNNALPVAKKPAKILRATRAVDYQLARDHNIWIIRADVAGQCGDRVYNGSSCITNPNGRVVQSAPEMSQALLVAEIKLAATVVRAKV